MKHFVDAIRKAMHDENWYAALICALVLPDICSKVENPVECSGRRRYIEWFHANLAGKYTHDLPFERHTFLSGEDCYALRCAYLHEGDMDITRQSARMVLERFVFVAPRPGRVDHCNKNGTTLQLQVDMFCDDVCQAVESWLERVADNEVIRLRMKKLAKIVGLPPSI
jgi:hypothetical protein